MGATFYVTYVQTRTIKQLREDFDQRFSDFRDHKRSFNLFYNPFSCVPEEEPGEIQFELINMQESSEARAAYRDRNHRVLQRTFPIHIPCTSPACYQNGLFIQKHIHLWESTIAINKSKLRSRLTDGHLHDVFRIATTEESWLTKNSTTNPMPIKIFSQCGYMRAIGSD